MEIFKAYRQQMITSFELKQSSLIRKIVDFLISNH